MRYFLMLTTIPTLAYSVPAFAEISQTIRYQGVLRDAEGAVACQRSPSEKGCKNSAHGHLINGSLDKGVKSTVDFF